MISSILFSLTAMLLTLGNVIRIGSLVRTIFCTLLKDFFCSAPTQRSGKVNEKQSSFAQIYQSHFQFFSWSLSYFPNCNYIIITTRMSMSVSLDHFPTYLPIQDIHPHINQQTQFCRQRLSLFSLFFIPLLCLYFTHKRDHSEFLISLTHFALVLTMKQ